MENERRVRMPHLLHKTFSFWGDDVFKHGLQFPGAAQVAVVRGGHELLQLPQGLLGELWCLASLYLLAGEQLHALCAPLVGLKHKNKTQAGVQGPSNV